MVERSTLTLESFGPVAGCIRALHREIHEVDLLSDDLDALFLGVPSWHYAEETFEENLRCVRCSLSEIRSSFLSEADELEDELQEIRESISLLPDDRSRQVAALYYVEGMTVESIAEVLHYSVRQIQRIKRALTESMK